ncbi:peptide/nickel transport system ATP-binding protein [Desulfobacula phenolica]|uniref:Peptide/nickel transport system ATP-binding protein n=1 Tax=Desulfobacula phenolica TaxID=90732 RepID=A0A1H2IC99_9BACT|nr:peptide/nickel transport system ATP-binding protein [Desulfobacula phenolica]
MISNPVTNPVTNSVTNSVTNPKIRPMIEITQLKKYYTSGVLKKRITKAVDGVDLSVDKGMIYGLTGESGCGKTTLAMAMLRLIEPTAGSIIINGKNIMSLGKAFLKKMRPRYQIIWQNPEASFNPRMRISDNILEPGRYYGKFCQKEEMDILSKYLNMVELPMDLVSRYPHEVSGGENQRAVIARMLTMEPELLIADEPTSSLDILVQEQILALLKKIQEQMNMTIVFISHDLRVIRYMCRKMAVMLEGKIVEKGLCETILSAPQHEYTRQLVTNTFGKWRLN